MLAHPLAQPDKGSGIAMICTFGDVTDIIWWRELNLPQPHHPRPRRPHRSPTAPDAIVDGCRRPPAYAGARRQDGVQRARSASSSCSRSPASSIGDPKPFTPRREVLREGRPPDSRSSRLASGTSATAPATRRCARSSSLSGSRCRGIPISCGCASRTGPTASPATGSSRASDSSVCRSPSGTALDENGERDYDRVLTPDHAVAARRPVHRRARGLHRRSARRPRRLRGRERHLRHVGDLVAHAAARRRLGTRPGAVEPRRTVRRAPAGPGHHPHVAVLDAAAQRPRGRPRAVDGCRHLGLHRRPRPQEDVEVQGQRRHARPTSSSSTARTR